MTQEKITKGIFWLGFMAFLATSIPHVAWLYHVYEPSEDIIWWVLAYAVAVGIDVLIAWLSFIQSGKGRRDTFITWCFIGSLCVLSWYANYLYSMAHDPIPTHALWNIGILWGLTTTGYITPIIVSALPVFVIAYTYMLHFVNNTKHETLEEKATRLENEVVARRRIREANKGKFTGLIKDAISSAGDIAVHTRNSLNDVRKDVETSHITEGSNTPVIKDVTLTSLSDVQKTPLVTWSEDGRVSSVQFPNREPVTILPKQESTPASLEQITPTEIHTDKLVVVGTVVSNGNGHNASNQFQHLERYVPKIRQQ